MTDLFEKNGSNQQQEPESFLNDLVGEGKQYSDPEALAKSKWHQDQHISRIEAENAEMRQEIQRRLAIEDYLKTQQSASSDNHERDDQPKNEFNPDDIRKEIMAEIENKLKEQSKRTVAERNVERVARELEAKWGSDYKSKLSVKATELKLDSDWLGKLAEENPDAFLTIVGANQSVPSFSGAPRSTLTAPQSTEADRNEAYYKKLRRENPKVYWDKKTQIQMHNDAVRLGDKFFI